MNNTALSTKDKIQFGSDVRTITSMEVADMVGKRHTDLIRDIRRYLEQLNESNIASGDFFMESTYKDANLEKLGEIKTEFTNPFLDRRVA